MRYLKKKGDLNDGENAILLLSKTQTSAETEALTNHQDI